MCKGLYPVKKIYVGVTIPNNWYRCWVHMIHCLALGLRQAFSYGELFFLADYFIFTRLADQSEAGIHIINQIKI